MSSILHIIIWTIIKLGVSFIKRNIQNLFVYIFWLCRQISSLGNTEIQNEIRTEGQHLFKYEFVGFEFTNEFLYSKEK